MIPIAEMPASQLLPARSTNASPLVDGYVAPGFELVREAFQSCLLEPGELGAAFSAVVDGIAVVDIWGGCADKRLSQPWKRETLAGILSGTKGLVALCLLKLIERGQLILDEPVYRYWPEFAARGKRNVLVRHLVSHLAGLPGLQTPVSPRDATDHLRMAVLLADQEPICEPGAHLYYHALTFGWLGGELIRRVDGRSVGRFFSDEIAEPLDLDLWIGLPDAEEPRVATMEVTRELAEDAERPDPDTLIDDLRRSIWRNPSRYSGDPLPMNTTFWRSAEIPGTNGIGSARALARLYGCLARGGELDDVRLIERNTLELGITPLSSAVEPLLDKAMSFGVGLQLQTSDRPFGPPHQAFGHTGAGGSVHGAWPDHKCGFSFLPNLLMSSDHARGRSARILGALFEALTVSVHECRLTTEPPAR